MFTVSKKKKRTCSTRPFLILIFLIGSLGITNAQKISKYFTSSMQSNGVLYFIEPKQKFKNNKGDCNLFYDLTYLTTNDTVTLNFTYSDKEIREIDSIGLILDNRTVSSRTKKIFIESKMSKWKHRYSSQFLFDDLDLFFKQQSSKPIFIKFTENSFLLKTRKRKWDKQSKILSKILFMIKVNKKTSP
tara:strand:+ start:116 stop:679 length:564 start_codon:yes stop_codon:yes gene_type:complete